MSEPMGLYQKYRPKDFDKVVGHVSQCLVLLNKLREGSLPHVCLLTGPSGVGKTTLARIVADKLGVWGSDLQEINCADVRGIDTVREIRDTMGYAPMSSKARAWILDEVVQLPKATQQAFLKILEDTPAHVYFLLCTSDTSGLLPTFLGRCFVLKLEALSLVEIARIVVDVVKAEKSKILNINVSSAICKAANGSARKALQMVEAVLSLETDEEQLEAIGATSVEGEEKVEFLAKALFRKAPWHSIVKVLGSFKEQDVESIRRQVLAYANKVMLNPKVTDTTRLAYLVIRAFEGNWFANGVASLTAACFECLQSKE